MHTHSTRRPAAASAECYAHDELRREWWNRNLCLRHERHGDHPLTDRPAPLSTQSRGAAFEWISRRSGSVNRSLRR
jgi:hypothetical protein